MAKARRMTSKPILDGSACASLGGNLNGPSLIKVPDWVKGARARYYLYFAHHEGRHIRLAFADHLEGPWTVHAPGALGLDQTPFPLAAPDVPQVISLPEDFAASMNSCMVFAELEVCT